MDCQKAEELFSDYLERTLSEPLRSELEAHLAECGACSELLAALAEVLAALHAAPVVEAPAGLAERAASAALRFVAARPRRVVMPAWLPVAAALLAVVTTTGVVVASGSFGSPRRTTRRLLERGANAASYLTERKDRLVEDLRLLRVIVATAFEGRLERVSDRVNDYRRLLEKRRAGENKEKRDDPQGASPGSRFQNPCGPDCVQLCGEAEGAVQAASARPRRL